MKQALVFILCVGLLMAESVFPNGIMKTPYEAFDLQVDFTPVIGTDGVTLVSVTAANVANGQDSTSQMIAASPIPAVVGSTDVVGFRVQGGVVNQTHSVSVKITDTATGAKYEGTLLVRVVAQ